MSDSIIKTEQLSVIHNQGKSNEVRSLVEANVEIFPEEYVIIHGPSGCGKSTLLYSIAGLQNPTAGKVSVVGKELSQMKKREKVDLHRNTIGMIFQAFFLIESLSVIDNICLPMTFKGASLKQRRETAMKLLHRFNIAEQAYKFPSQLSGGQKQRVAIARSLINDPKIILADEPVGNLDSESSLNVMKIIKELNEVDKKTIILVTHNSEHLVYGDRVISMQDGKIIKEEINKEKRPPEANAGAGSSEESETSPELKMLMRAFSGLTPQQAGALLVPYKSRQLLSHILSELTEEQLNLADNFLKELIYENIDIVGLELNLDKSFNKGGANWNSRKAKTFSRRVKGIMQQANFIRNDREKAAENLANYLIEFFDLKLNSEDKIFLSNLLGARLENKIDHVELKDKMDKPKILGGLGLYRNTVEKIAKEIEIIMLIVYLA